MPDHPDLVLIGAGGQACVLAEAALLTGWEIRGHVSPEPGADTLVGTWLGDDTALPGLLADGRAYALGMGFVDAAGVARRARVMSYVSEASLATIVHPEAIVSPSARLHQGVFVAAGAVIATLAEVGAAVLVNTGAIVEHHCRIGLNSHIATGARLTGSVTVGRDCLVGAGAVIRQGLVLGDGVVIGAGATVLSDVPAGAIWGGTPARPLGVTE